jgi:hypothetical protein
VPLDNEWFIKVLGEADIESGDSNNTEPNPRAKVPNAGGRFDKLFKPLGN